MDDEPGLVTLHVWGVPAARVPGALARMAVHRRALDRGRTNGAGPAFAKLVGTGRGRTFTVRDADPRHWGLVSTWADPAHAVAFEAGAVVGSWDAIASERLRIALRPLASRGRWSGQMPFGEPLPAPYEGPVAALTRARIAARRTVRFWRAVPPVSADLHDTPGLRLAIGIGEAPVGLQGTFSLWDSAGSLREFAHERSPHRHAVRQTAEFQWYTEELFARFAVLDVEGTLHGRSP